jgi:hypothetical protein
MPAQIDEIENEKYQQNEPDHHQPLAPAMLQRPPERNAF